MKADKTDIAPKCEQVKIHPDIIGQVSSCMLSDELAMSLSELYRIFADKTRIRILYLLNKHEMCVCDIAELLDMTQSAISHQLSTLKAAGLVRYRRDGKTVFYSLADEHVEMILNMGLEHVMEP